MDGDFRDYLVRARELHREAIVVDTHVDTTQRLMNEKWSFSDRHETGHVDLPRLREGGVGAVFLALWTPQSSTNGEYAPTIRSQFLRLQQLCKEHAGDLALAQKTSDVFGARKAGRIAVLLGVEGGYLIDDSLDILREYRAAGARYLTLTHAQHTNWADSSGVHEPLSALHGGLTDFGREVIREMNRLGLMVDVSHVSDQTFWDVVETTPAPIIASHSSCRTVSNHRRNLSDEMIRAIAAAGGVVQINFASLFIDPDHPPVDLAALRRRLTGGSDLTAPVTMHRTPLSRLVDHFEHAYRLVGPQHVGIGSDFDGVPAVPSDMEDCSKLPNLTASLLQRGIPEADVRLMLGANVLRVMDACDRYAKNGPLRSMTASSDRMSVTR